MPQFAKTQTGFAIVCLFLLAATSRAQVSQEWDRRFDGSYHGNDGVTSLIVDHAGNVIVAGYSNGGYLTVKYSAEGDTIWSKNDDFATSGPVLAVAVDADDNVYVTGYTYTGWVNTGNMILTSKYSAEGHYLWGRGFDGGGGPAEDIGYDVAVDDSGHVYVTGLATLEGRTGVCTLKYDRGGTLSATWPSVGWGTGVRRYDIPEQFGYQAGTALVVDAQQNVYVVGVSAPGNGAPTDFVTLKYDANGQELWARRYDGPAGQEDTPVAIALDDSCNVFVAGTVLVSNQSGAARADYATIKYDTDGNQKWVALYNGPADYEDRCAALAVDRDGNAYVTGCASAVSADYATVKYDRNGDEVWVAFNDGGDQSSDEATALAVDDAGCVYVTGKTSTNLGMWDYETVKYDASGQDVWSIDYSGPDLYGDRPAAIGLGPAGAVYVAGTSGSATCGDDWMTVKYLQDVTLVEGGIPATCMLIKGYPNPFNPATTIAFDLTRAQRVTLKVYDLTGREIATLVDGDMDAGSHHRTFRADGLACGTYLCRLQAGGFTATRKLLLVK